MFKGARYHDNLEVLIHSVVDAVAGGSHLDYKLDNVDELRS